MGKRILLIGCDLDLRDELAGYLSHGLLEIIALPDLRDLDLLQHVHEADLLILHQRAVTRDLPRTVTHLRGHTPRPLLIMLAPFTEDNVADVLEAGADDVLPLDVSSRELLARIRAHLRRDQEYSVADVPASLQVGDLVVDVARHEVRLGGRLINLTPREFDLLEHLARHAGRAVRREELLERVWGYNSEMMTRTLDVHVGRLRQKIETDARRPERIITVPGVGYKLATG